MSDVVNLTAAAGDNEGVSQVQFLLNGLTFEPAVTSAPYSVTWNTADFDDGAYSITAAAIDAAGNQTTSAAVEVTVDNNGGEGPGQTFLAELFPVSQVHLVQTTGVITLNPMLEFETGLQGVYDCYAAFSKDGDIYLAEEDLLGDIVFVRFRDGDNVKNFAKRSFSGETSWTSNVFSSMVHPQLDVINNRGVVFLIAVAPVGGGPLEGAIFTFGE